MTYPASSPTLEKNGVKHDGRLVRSASGCEMLLRRLEQRAQVSDVVLRKCLD